MFVMDFEIEGFSATQRTIIDCDHLRSAASIAKEEDDGPNATLTPYTVVMVMKLPIYARRVGIHPSRQSRAPSCQSIYREPS